MATETVRYVRVARFSELTGYTDKAVRRKIEDGVWLEGREYRRAPDNADVSVPSTRPPGYRAGTNEGEK